ncbi:triple tyrosine motif-containing protein [Bacillus pinisoli]|uniref:triple tyrosine motif-containing protein n=1 Tax=Bacillus pinisoli TaxID=2901866 RepID=UPI003AF0452F
MKKLTSLIIFFCGLFLGTSSIQAEASDQLIIINKSTNKLAFFENGKVVRVFKVATGRSGDYTPEGTFPIVNKIKNRPYYKENIPGGHPNNPLGDRWLGLNARGTYGTTYAIHGNANPASIGTYASAGCVRMYDEEVRWLFDHVKLHTNVVITRSSQSFEAIAASKGYTPYSKLTSISVDQSSPQPIHTKLIVSAKANLKSHYRFFILVNGEWKVVQDYSTSSKLNWKPETQGSYQIKVQAKSLSSKKEFDDEKVISYEVFAPATIKAFKSNSDGPLPTNSDIHFSTATDEETSLFQYEVFDGTAWSVLQEYSSEAGFNWKPEQPGTYKVRTRVKHSISQNEFDDERELEITIFKPASLTVLQADLESPQPIHTVINVSSKTNQDASVLYKFDVYDGENWRTIQDYSTSAMVEWKPDISGIYQIKVQAKHELSKEEFDSEEVISYQIYQPARVEGLFSNSKGIQQSQHSIEVETIHKEEVLYRFSLFTGTKWVILQDYSSSHQLKWNPEMSGMYLVKVEVKHTLSDQEYDDAHEIPFIIYHHGYAQAVLTYQQGPKRSGPFLVQRSKL